MVRKGLRTWFSVLNYFHRNEINSQIIIMNSKRNKKLNLYIINVKFIHKRVSLGKKNQQMVKTGDLQNKSKTNI